MITQPPPARPVSLKELHTRARSPEALALYLDAIRRVLGADAVQLVRYHDESGENREVVAEATPSEEISRNLLGTAGNPPANANGAGMVVSKYRFGPKLVHLIAAHGSGREWLLVWLRLPETTPAEAVAGVVELAVLGLPGSGRGDAEEEGGKPTAAADLLPAIDPTAKRSARLVCFARWLAHRLGAAELFLMSRGAFGWGIAASANQLPSRTGPLAHAVVHAMRRPSQGADTAAMEEIRRLTGHPSAQIIQWNDRHAAVVAGGASLAPDPAVQKLAGELLTLIDADFSTLGTLRARWRAASRLRRATWGIGIAVFCGLMLLPVHQRVRSHILLEPSVRRFVSAPFNGILQKVHVRGGDIVAQGALLAEMDGREIAERLADVEARLSSAMLQNTAEVESSNYGEAAVRALDAMGLTHERALLRHQQANLKLHSPIRGVVVTGELERSEGAAVELGRTLLEIAPLDTLLVEVAVDESDIALIREGMPIDVQLNALPGRTFEATVEKVQLRSETREGFNIFVVEARLANTDDLLRPGMKGRAIVYADHKPLVWTLVRKPVQTVQKWMFR